MNLFIDGACGISGDMFVSALIDLGADVSKLKVALSSLHFKDDFDYTISKKKTYGISGSDFDVILKDKKRDPHHHEEHEHHEHREHRHLSDIIHIIDTATMSENSKNLAKKIFLIIAKAESEAHECDIEEVHFHEVGAIDSIVDIISASVLYDSLNITECVVCGFCEGSGFVSCQHGSLPVPVPAVLNIAREYKIPLTITDSIGEMITPTGIAIACAIMTTNILPKNFVIEKSGTGLGKKDFGRANFLRTLIINKPKEDDISNNEDILVIETNIDDSNGEDLGFAMDKLFEAGAKDVHYIPCFMKKNRPSYLLRIIISKDKENEIEEIIFKHTSTIGLRKTLMKRTCMEREMIETKLPYGNINVKKCRFNDIVRFYPEYESMKKLANENNISIKTVLNDFWHTNNTFNLH